MPILLGETTGVSSLNDVPDSIPPVGPGIYLWEVTGVSLKASKPKNDPSWVPSNNIVIEQTIVDSFPPSGQDNPFKGRKRDQYFNLPNANDPAERKNFKLVGLKQLALACGFKAEEFSASFDFELCKGKRFLQSVNTSTYQDPKTGQVKQGTELGDMYRPDGSSFRS